MKYLKQLLLGLLLILSGIGLYSIYSFWADRGPKEEVKATVLLERIEKVMKLVTVEGNFSEIYDYKNHYVADIWPFRKKALVRVKAKVLVGFDFEKVELTIREDDKSITIKEIPLPEIISIEHDMDYYNFENGLFNMITNKDITEMGTRAKQFIVDKAEESDLFDRAEEQRIELFELLETAISASGWTLEIGKDDTSLKN